MDSSTSAIIESAKIALGECLKLQSTEQLLVVCDPPCFEVGQALWEAGRQMCTESVMVQMSPRKVSGNEPPEPVGEWFGQFDVAVMPTSRSLSHTRARRAACEKGTRVATLPGITEDIFLRTMKTDWKRLGELTRHIASQLSSVKEIHIRTDAGTDLRFRTGGRDAEADDGAIYTKGAFGNLPAGEAYMAPLEGSAEGRLVVDGSFPFVGMVKEPLVIDIKEGLVNTIHDHPVKNEFETALAKYGTDARNVAEFGVGTLDSAHISGNILEDEKVLGTIHIAFGDNSSMGGRVSVPIHLDGIVKAPSVWLDGALWMEKGVVVV